MNLTQEQVRSVSTHGELLLLRGENMDTFVTSYGDQWVDPLTPRITDLQEVFQDSLTQYKYIGGKPITTVSYELYGTTSAWWIILYLNGIMHPDEMSDGMTLKVPTPEAIQSLTRDTVVNNIGKVIRT